MAALDGLAKVSDPAVTDTPGIFASFFGPDPLNLLFVVILTSLGTWGLPQMVQKFYAIKDENPSKKVQLFQLYLHLLLPEAVIFSVDLDVFSQMKLMLLPTDMTQLFRQCFQD